MIDYPTYYIIARDHASLLPIASKIDTHDNDGVMSIPVKFQIDILIIGGDIAIFIMCTGLLI